MANYKSGMKMQMGSKQKNTPSNFSGSAFKMITGEDPSSDFFENIDPMNSLGQNTTDDMNEQFDEMKAGYQPPVELVSKNTSGSPEAYASLGRGLRNLIKPKEGTEGYARQQERKESRKLDRIKRGFGEESKEYTDQKIIVDNKSKIKGTQTKVGEKLRNIKKKIFK